MKRGFIYLAGFIGSIWFANWLIANVGYQFDPNGPHMIPVWPGIMAPSGVLAIGLGFTMRDLVHSELGAKWAIVGVIIGAIVSAALSPALALASGVAFLFSELMDLFVYVPLRQHNIIAAVVASNVVGLIADSVLFLWLAFGSLEYIEGQIIGKLWMTLLVVVIMVATNRNALEVKHA